MTAGNGLPCVRCGTSEWYAGGNCKKCMKERTLSWQRANANRVTEYKRRWQRANPDKVAARGRRWRQANPERQAETQRRRRQANPEKQAEENSRYRTQKTGAGGSFTAGEWKALCSHYGNKCVRCGRNNVKLTFDHIIPVSKGGTSDISNGQPLCLSCNSSKQDRHIDYRPDAGPMRWTQPALLSIQNE